MSHAKSAEKVVQDIRRKTRRRFSAEEKIRIVLEGMRGEESIAGCVRPRTGQPVDLRTLACVGVCPGGVHRDTQRETR